MKKIKPYFLLGSLILCLVVYFPVLNGLPIWDDLGLWFLDPTTQSDFSYFKIWSQYSWPFSVSFQKLAFDIWGFNYQTYHVFSLFFHMLNSLMIYHLAAKFKLPFAEWLYLLFLFHPVNVISVSWIIQIKTLLCFFFAILSIIIFEKALSKKALMPFSWGLFFLSIASKSASVTLPVLFVIYGMKHLKRLGLIWVLPFFLISGWGTYRLLSSRYTRDAVTNLKQSSIMKVQKEETREGVSLVDLEPIQASKAKEVPEVKKGWISKFRLILKTTKYYFWQSLLPIENYPVKNFNVDKMVLSDFLHILFFITIGIVLLESNILLLPLSGLILLSPFMGLLPAPFMNITWVSDQHLYLSLPFFLAFWLMFLKTFPLKKFVSILPVLFLTWFVYASYESTAFYKNDLNFYSAGLKGDPDNIAIGYNLAVAYGMNGEFTKGLRVVEGIYAKAESHPEMKNNKYFIHLENLRLRLMELKTKK